MKVALYIISLQICIFMYCYSLNTESLNTGKVSVDHSFLSCFKQLFLGSSI